jgi:transcriptional regulator GlxA family with amidase domain
MAASETVEVPYDLASQPLHELQVWMLQHLRGNLTVESLAERIDMSARR